MSCVQHAINNSVEILRPCSVRRAKRSSLITWLLKTWGLTLGTLCERSLFRPYGLVRGDNTATLGQQSCPSLLFAEQWACCAFLSCEKSWESGDRQLWWDPGTRGRTLGGGVCCGNPWSPCTPTIFSDSGKKANVTELPFAMQIVSRRKEKRTKNQWSCISLLTANVLHILILDPFPAVPQTNWHCA